MRTEEEIRDQLSAVRRSLEEATMSMSQGRMGTIDFSGIATAVGVIQSLDWVLGEADHLTIDLSHPLRRPLEDI